MLTRATIAIFVLLALLCLQILPASAEEAQPAPEQPAAATEAEQPSDVTTEEPQAEEPAATSEEQALEETATEGAADDSWDEDTSWQSQGLKYYGTLTYWHSLDRTSRMDKHEGEFSLSFSLDEYQGRLRIGNFNPYASRRDDIRIEKVELGGLLGKFNFSMGTFPQTLGKGLVLSGIEQRDIDVDNEIEGFRLSYPGKHFSALGFIGQHKLVTDIGATKVYGGRVEAKPWDWFTVGGNAFSYRPVKKGLGGAPDVRIENGSYSFDTALKFKAVSAYFEYMRQDWAADTDGRGMYGNVSLSLPGLGLTYEYKDYWKVNGFFSGPPPVRYAPEYAAADLLDEKGYGVILSWTPFKSSSLIEASYAQANVRAKGMPMTEFIIAYHSPTEKRFNWIAQRLYHNSLFLKNRAYYVEAAYSWNDFFTTQVACEIRNKDEGLGSRDEQEISIDFGYGGWLTLVISQEKAERGFNKTAQRWTIAEVKLQDSGKQELSLAYGKRRAGIVCSGGVCRLEPEFSGWKLEYRFFF